MRFFGGIPSWLRHPLTKLQKVEHWDPLLAAYSFIILGCIDQKTHIKFHLYEYYLYIV